MDAPKIDTADFINNDPTAVKDNERHCPNCDLMTLKGMPGGRDSTCTNCGYKDPCCYD